MKRIVFLAWVLLMAVSMVAVPLAPAFACPSRWTGGGTIDTGAIYPAGVRVTHGFELHTGNPPPGPNNLEVNWGGNRFHMTELTFAESWLNESFPGSEHPIVPVNFVEGYGVGRYNGVDGYRVYFEFTDFGEPGVLDMAKIEIRTGDNTTLVMKVNGTLEYGNHQAHPTKK